jgi:hypothetical protein
MKSKIAIVLAAAAMTLSASSAFAYFGDLELYRVVYEKTTGTVEIATDLGSISSLTAYNASTTVAGSFGTVGTPANLFVSYFAFDKTGTNAKVWIANGAGAPNNNTTGWLSGKSSLAGVQSYYTNTLGGLTAQTVTATQTNGNSFKTKLNGTAGFLGNILGTTNRAGNELNLAALVNGTAGSLTQSLYYFSSVNTTGNTAVKVANIITNSNGSTTINSTVAPAVPVPAAIYLMGSGLLGLVGLRRRNKA